jgi:roadblock/LC7 domain-containing protein
VIRRLLAVDGVVAVCHFRDDGALVEGYGRMPDQQLQALAHFAHDYKRLVQGNIDQLAMFTGIDGWTPPGGWIVHGAAMTVCGAGNLVCVLENAAGNPGEVMRELGEAARY